MFNHLIFDFDDTLYNYSLCNEKGINNVFNYISSSFGLDINNIKDIFNNLKKKYQNTVFNQAASHNKYIQLKKLCEYLKLPIQQSCIFYDLYLEEFNKNLKLFDHAEEFLLFCQDSNINCFILTNNICYEQINRLEKLNITKYFKKIYTSEEFGIEKPDSKIFYSILQENNININEVAMIGDSFKNDVESVNLLNIYAFWFHKSQIIFNKKYCEFNNFKQLLDFYNKYYSETRKFIKLSKYCGERYDLVQAGGGNISFKQENFMFIKSSGCLLSDLDINKNYVGMNKDIILDNLNNIKDENKKIREKEAKKLCYDSIYFLKNYTPSIETTMHSLTQKYTLHLHPLQFLKICGLENCYDLLKDKFENFCFINYFTPGIDVALELHNKYNNEKIIFLKNHGIVITSNKIDEIYILLTETIDKLENIININFNTYKITNYISQLMNSYTNNLTVSYLCSDSNVKELYNENIKLNPYFPDKLVYCGIDIVHLKKDSSIDKESIITYYETYGEIPKLFFYQNNIYINSNSLKKCKEIESVFKSHLLSYDINNRLLETKENNYLNNWDAEKLRKLI